MPSSSPRSPIRRSPWRSSWQTRCPNRLPFDRTAAILRLVRERTTVSAPAILAADTSYRDCPWRFLITTVLPGVSWYAARQQWTPEDRSTLWWELGRAVAALHTLHFPNCGEIEPTGMVLAGTSYPLALAARARRRIADPGHAARFLALLAARTEAFAPSARPVPRPRRPQSLQPVGRTRRSDRPLAPDWPPRFR